MFSIFLSGVLQPSEEYGGSTGQPTGERNTWWCEWKQDCLSALLKLLVQFGVDPQDYEVLADQMLEGSSTPKKRIRRCNPSNSARKNSGTSGSEHAGRLLVPRLSRYLKNECPIKNLISLVVSAKIVQSILRPLFQLF